MTNKKKKVVLIILDGWGKGDQSVSDAIFNSNTPFVDSLYQTYPHTELLTSGENVGLPDGQMGNSEVGHLNIGAGRIVYQDLVKINKAVREQTIDTNPVLKDAFDYAKKNKQSVHFIGLVSNGGVHSSQEHLHYLCDLTKKESIERVFIHAFTDGRDTDPKSGLTFISELEAHLKQSKGELVSLVGRYYAMDRDKRWERIKLAHDLLLKGTGETSKNLLDSIQKAYEMGITDEFIKPIVKVDKNGIPIGRINKNDVVLCFNFRTDRCREITQTLTQQSFEEFEMTPIPLHYITMTRYDSTFKNVKVLFEKDNLAMTLGEVISGVGKKQIRIAETEKYPHVTFFFSGGREKEYEGEKRIMVNSPKVATYDLQPEMSANEVTSAIVAELKKEDTDFVCLNFANPDMVGHTGIYSAVKKAVETIDQKLEEVVKTGIAHGYSFIIIADHGNADYMINADGSPNTAHTTNPVPCILIDTNYKKINSGILADIAPTILKLMGVTVPNEMTGTPLI